MPYDREDMRNRSRDDRDRWSNDRHHDRGRSGGRDERGFFERAGDQIASWLGEDDRSDRSRDRGGYGRDRQEERGFFGSRERDDGGFRREDAWQDRGRGRDEGDYRPMTGDYGRSERFSSGRSLDDRNSGSLFGQGQRTESNWDRDDHRNTSFSGSRDVSQHHDPHYRQWREQQMSELDRDYEDYHRERQSRFEDDFGSWRDRRQQKRQTLGQVREQMEVVGNDGEHVGTVDRTAGDRIILNRSDPQAGGAHHSIGCTDVDRVEGNRVFLDCTAEDAKKRWRNEDRSRALFEREDQGQDGPHMLDRSFSGTYRD